MITVKLYGLIRLDYGIREVSLEAGSVRQIYDQLEQRGIPQEALRKCLVLINGKSANTRAKVTEGDTVQIMSPVAGG